jgi:hypothetical protein
MPIHPSPPLLAHAAAAAAFANHHPPLPLHPFPTPIPSSSPMPSPAAAPTYIDATNQNGVIAIVTGFSLCVVLLSGGVRLYARRYASAYRWDDVAFYITAVLGVGQVAVGLYMVGEGLGKTVEKLGKENFVDIRNVSFFFGEGEVFCPFVCLFVFGGRGWERGEVREKRGETGEGNGDEFKNERLTSPQAQVANHILYVSVLCFSKLSCASTFLWLTPYEAQRRAAWVLVGAASVWGVTSVFIEGFSCDTFPKQCPGSVCLIPFVQRRMDLD